MTAAKRVLLLDDDTDLLQEVGEVLTVAGFEVARCSTVKIAVMQLAVRPDFALVDLFLDGNLGDELSNGFVRDHLLPNGIPYGRLSSAPGLVPKEYSGSFVMHKREFGLNPEKLVALVELALVS